MGPNGWHGTSSSAAAAGDTGTHTPIRPEEETLDGRVVSGWDPGNGRGRFQSTAGAGALACLPYYWDSDSWCLGLEINCVSAPFDFETSLDLLLPSSFVSC